MPYLTVNGLNLHFLATGRRDEAGRPAIVLLHGLGSAADDWPLQLPAFAARRRVIAVDLPGHGRSEQPRRMRLIPQMASDIGGLVERLEAPRAHWVGLSLGACVALQAAIDSPARVRSLVLTNGFARLRPAGWRGALRFGRRLWLLAFAPMPAMAEVAARGLFPKPEHHQQYLAARARLAANPRRAYWNAIRALVAFNALNKLERVHCPTLIVAGDRDLTIPMAAKVRLQEGIPGARLVVVPDSGHATPHDQPEIFNRTVMEWIASLG